MPTGEVVRVEVVAEVEVEAAAKVEAGVRKAVAKAVRARESLTLGLHPEALRLTTRGFAQRVGPGDIGHQIVPRSSEVRLNGRQQEVGVHPVVKLGSVTMNMKRMRLLGRRT